MQLVRDQKKQGREKKRRPLDQEGKICLQTLHTASDGSCPPSLIRACTLVLTGTAELSRVLVLSQDAPVTFRPHSIWSRSVGISGTISCPTPLPKSLLLLEKDGRVVEQTLQGSQAFRPLSPFLDTEEEVPTKLFQLCKLVFQLLQMGERRKETVSLPTNTVNLRSLNCSFCHSIKCTILIE